MNDAKAPEPALNEQALTRQLRQQWLGSPKAIGHTLGSLGDPIVAIRTGEGLARAIVDVIKQHPDGLPALQMPIPSAVISVDIWQSTLIGLCNELLQSEKGHEQLARFENIRLLMSTALLNAAKELQPYLSAAGIEENLAKARELAKELRHSGQWSA